MAEQAAERVVARQTVLQLKKAAQKGFFGRSKFRHIDRALASTQNGAQGDHEKLMEIIPPGVPASRVIQAGPAGGKLLQDILTGCVFDTPW